MTDARIGTELAGYRLERLIGRGGMGEVYLATQSFPERRVAVKVLARELAEDGDFRERFIRESNAAASTEHPNIVPIYGAGEHDGVLYLAMRYVEGVDLGTLIARDGPLDPTRAVRIVTQVAAALDAAHRRGLVHRDVKPGNILIA
jgi:serine/threonine protein kinase